jgi:hypothetical protein
MWWWATVAWGAPIAAEEAAQLGPPLTHEIDVTSGTLRLAWHTDGGEDKTHEVAIATIVDVRRVADPSGPHLLLVSTSDGGWVLERGPCAIMAAMAPKLAAELDRPLVDGPACADPNAETRAWMQERIRTSTFTHVQTWDGAILADVRVTERESGAPALDVQRGLVGARPMLGHCFSQQPEATRAAAFDATVRPNGSLGRVSPVMPGTGSLGVDGCLEERLDDTSLREPPDRKRKVHIEVSAP